MRLLAVCFSSSCSILLPYCDSSCKWSGLKAKAKAKAKAKSLLQARA